MFPSKYNKSTFPDFIESLVMRGYRFFNIVTLKSVLLLFATFEIVASGQDYAFTNFAGLPGVSGTNNGSGSAARFNNPAAVAVDSAGNVYVADTFNHMIRKITPASVVTTLAGSARHPGAIDEFGTDAQFNTPIGIGVDSAGNVYVSDTINHTIRKITPPGEVTTIAGTPGVKGNLDGTNSAALFNRPHGIAVDPAGNLYVGDTENYEIRKITPMGSDWVVTTLAGTGFAGMDDGNGIGASFSKATGVTVSTNGTVFVGDTDNHTIRMITPAGDVTTIAGLPGSSGSADGTGFDAQFNSPRHVALDKAGNLYVADRDNQKIRKVSKVDTDWVVTTIAGLVGNAGTNDGVGSEARFSSPIGIVVDNAGKVYVADYNNHRITKGTLPLLQISSIKFVSGDVQIDFNASPADTPDLFTLQSSLNASGNYGDVSATITSLGAGSFRAVIPPSGARQFYRIKR
jgi:serine/threonine protein kinase, bacterial